MSDSWWLADSSLWEYKYQYFILEPCTPTQKPILYWSYIPESSSCYPFPLLSSSPSPSEKIRLQGGYAPRYHTNPKLTFFRFNGVNCMTVQSCHRFRLVQRGIWFSAFRDSVVRLYSGTCPRPDRKYPEISYEWWIGDAHGFFVLRTPVFRILEYMWLPSMPHQTPELIPSSFPSLFHSLFPSSPFPSLFPSPFPSPFHSPILSSILSSVLASQVPSSSLYCSEIFYHHWILWAFTGLVIGCRTRLSCLYHVLFRFFFFSSLNNFILHNYHFTFSFLIGPHVP